MSVLVILPTYNEIASLEDTIRSIRENCPEVELLIVDDASPDGTGKLAEQLAAQDDHIKVLHRKSKEGLGPAYLAGFSQALEQGYEFIVEMDADGSHQAQDLKRLLDHRSIGTLVIGSRWVSGGEVANWSKFRVAVSSIGNRYAGWMLRSKLRDLTAGFRVYASDLLEKIIQREVSAHGYSFQVELAARAEKIGAVVEVPITFIERAHGRSKMSLRIVIEALWLITKWGVALRFSREDRTKP